VSDLQIRTIKTQSAAIRPSDLIARVFLSGGAIVARIFLFYCGQNRQFFDFFTAMRIPFL